MTSGWMPSSPPPFHWTLSPDPPFLSIPLTLQVSEPAADALADPSAHPELFPDLDAALQVRERL